METIKNEQWAGDITPKSQEPLHVVLYFFAQTGYRDIQLLSIFGVTVGYPFSFKISTGFDLSSGFFLLYLLQFKNLFNFSGGTSSSGIRHGFWRRIP
jgi:hypothetical protein